MTSFYISMGAGAHRTRFFGVCQMSKLLATYRTAPTFKNAQKVRAYERKHAFAICLLSADDAALVATAIHHANTPQD
jgi:hypothetical protein